MAKNTVKTKTPISTFFRKIFYTSLVLCTISIASIIFLHQFLPPEIPLLYGLPDGEQQLSERYYLILPCLVSLIITLLNYFVSSATEDKFIRGVLIATGFVTCLLSFITTFKIFFLVGTF